MSTEQEVLTAAEAAAYLRVSKSTVYQRKDIPRHRMPGFRGLRFLKGELIEFLKGNARGQTSVATVSRPRRSSLKWCIIAIHDIGHNMSYSIQKRRTKKGVAYDLYYRWRGQRYRPLLRYDLEAEEAERRAHEMIYNIHRADETLTPTEPPRCPTLRQFLPVYWQTLTINNRIDFRRPAIIVERHLLPHFGDCSLNAIKPENGLLYITARFRDGAAPGTVRKEWGVLMRILNLAVDYEKLDRNRLKRVQLPPAHRRTRVATAGGLQAIQGVAGEELWRIVLVALNTGLREAKILEIERYWMQLRDDGWWLILPQPRTVYKGTPRELPLNQLAVDALRAATSMMHKKIFTGRSGDAVNKAWSRATKRAHVSDLHFHDLRHTFTTLLQNIGVPFEIRAALLGHRLRSDAQGGAVMTVQYSHGGQGWNAQLRRAVSGLETTMLSYGLSYRPGIKDNTLRVEPPNPLEEQDKMWWSQREYQPFDPASRTVNPAILWRD